MQLQSFFINKDFYTDNLQGNFSSFVTIRFRANCLKENQIMIFMYTIVPIVELFVSSRATGQADIPF